MEKAIEVLGKQLEGYRANLAECDKKLAEYQRLRLMYDGAVQALTGTIAAMGKSAKVGKAEVSKDSGVADELAEKRAEKADGKDKQEE